MTVTATHIQQFLDDHSQEGLYIEFKRGEALMFSSESRRELIKDCTGFANGGGGTIVYGIAEENIDGIPAATSLSPVVETRINADWLNDVIRSNTSPPLTQFEITEIPVRGGRVLTIEIPASSTAHQNILDHRYYLRAGRGTAPMVDFQIRDVMNRRLKPEVQVKHRLVRYPTSDKKIKPEYRRALKVLVANVGQVTMENWRFEFDLPFEIIRDSDYGSVADKRGVLGHAQRLVQSWDDLFSVAYDSRGKRLFRVMRVDPDEEQRRNRLHPGQTVTLVDPDKHPAVIVELDQALWEKIRGRSMFWRIFLPNTQPITGEWGFDEWCDF